MDGAPAAGEVDRFISQLRSGDSVAAGRLFRDYASQLAGVVRRRLGWRYSRKIDPEDVVQSVFRSFVRCQRNHEVRFDNWDALWGFLSLIAMRKAGRVASHFTAARRNLAFEHSVVHLDNGDVQPRAEGISREPDPLHLVMITDTIDHLMHELDARDRGIVRMALEGSSTEAIATAVGCSERTVQRVLRRLSAWLEEDATGHSPRSKPR